MTETELSRFNEDEAWTPYVTITYRYNPADTIGKYLKSKSDYKTTRGWRVHNKASQTWSSEAALKDYESYIRAFDKVFRGVDNVRKIKTIPDTFTIVIGIVKLGLMHENVDGDGTIDFQELFRLLSQRGFDPLKILRNKRVDLSNELGLKIRKTIDGRGLSRDSLLTVAKDMAKKCRDIAQEYIKGGKKPSLSKNTIEQYRPDKQEHHPELYHGSRGIREPLYESGQLHDAIGWDVVVYQSPEMAAFAEQLVEQAEKMKQAKQRIDAHKRLRIAVDRRIKQMTHGRTLTSSQYAALEDSIFGTLVRSQVGLNSPFKSSRIRNVPKNPTQRQAISLERRLLSLVGMRKVDLKKQAETLSDKIVRLSGGHANPNIDYRESSKKVKRLQQELSDTMLLLNIHKSGYALQGIGSVSVGKGGDVSSRATTENRLTPENSNNRTILEDIAKTYHKLERRNITPNDLKVWMLSYNLYGMHGIGENDIRLALMYEDILKKYGREEF